MPRAPALLEVKGYHVLVTKKAQASTHSLGRMGAMEWNESEFHSRLRHGLQAVKRVLHVNREPRAAEAVPHTYDDKFLLAENVVKVALAATLNALSIVGLSADEFVTLRTWVQKDKQTAILRLSMRSKCTFVKEQKREVEGPKTVTEKKGLFGSRKVSSGVVTTVTEYVWTHEISYRIVAFSGSHPIDSGNTRVLRERTDTAEEITAGKSPPYGQSEWSRPDRDLDLSWLLNCLREDGRTVDFDIDRSDPTKCHTPRRNPDVSAAIDFFHNLLFWGRALRTEFSRDYFPELSKIRTEKDVFVPINALLETRSTEEGQADGRAGEAFDASGGGDQRGGAVVHTSEAHLRSSVMLRPSDTAAFLSEQLRTLEQKLGDASQGLPRGLSTAAESSLVVLAGHLQDIARELAQGLNYVEHLVRTQLIAAIGKELTPADFAEYMRFHCRKMFHDDFKPIPCCYAVRRPEHYPEGLLSLTASDGKGDDPTPTFARRLNLGEDHTMRFSINAATEVKFCGETYLHALVMHKFSSQRESLVSLCARARQFSSFILLVGSILSKDVFAPKAAVMISNNDDLKLPLIFETIPTPKQFKEAISALSDEQKRFAKACASRLQSPLGPRLQLEMLASTLFGVLVVQVKPNIERLLLLDDDSLTKEIELTQTIQELLVKYQIPSDMLKFDRAAMDRPSDYECTAQDKVEFVRGQTEKLSQLIAEMKEKEIHEAAQERAAQLLRNTDTPSTSESSSSSRGSMRSSDYSDDDSLESSEEECEEEEEEEEGECTPRDRMRSPARRSRVAMPKRLVQSREEVNMKVVVDKKKASNDKPAKPKQDPPDDRKTKQQAQGERTGKQEGSEGTDTDAVALDATLLPTLLESRMRTYDTDDALRPTIIKLGETWTRRRQANILVPMQTSKLEEEEQVKERNIVFDLLDALSCSGVKPLVQSQLHVMVAATHCFDETLLETVVQRNTNPIEKLERSLLIAASVVFSKRFSDLLRRDFEPIVLAELDEEEKEELE